MTFAPEMINALRRAQCVTVLTGAGISAESGVPTFRDAQTGVWAQFKPEELATPEAFRRNPQRVWEWYALRRAQVATVNPNPGHYALTEIEQRVAAFTLITQNVDGLHQRAGSHHILELHGNLTRAKCFEEDVVIEHWQETGKGPPCCPRCGGFLRPDVVWFGEILPVRAFTEAEQASLECDVFLSVGTSALVYPAAALPYHALRTGAVVIEINTEPTPLTEAATFTLQGPSGRVLPELVRAVWPAKKGSDE